MGKNKPRHDPNKPQNKYGNECWYVEEINGHLYCTRYGTSNSVIPICKGNPHNCIKTKYHRLASMSNIQKNELNK
jgi:hypothetical protein